MKKIFKVFLCFIIGGGIFLIAGVIPVYSQEIYVDDQSGNAGDTVIFTVSIDNTSNEVASIGFDIRYDKNVLQYTGSFYRGYLTGDFDFFDVNEKDRGQIRIGGFTTDNKILEGDSGVLVNLEFKVVKEDNTTLGIENLVDDVTGWKTDSGYFSGEETPSQADTNSSSEESEKVVTSYGGGQDSSQNIIGTDINRHGGLPLYEDSRPSQRGGREESFNNNYKRGNTGIPGKEVSRDNGLRSIEDKKAHTFFNAKGEGMSRDNQNISIKGKNDFLKGYAGENIRKNNGKSMGRLNKGKSHPEVTADKIINRTSFNETEKRTTTVDILSERHILLVIFLVVTLLAGISVIILREKI